MVAFAECNGAQIAQQPWCLIARTSSTNSAKSPRRIRCARCSGCGTKSSRGSGISSRGASRTVAAAG
eukprot:6273590-Amphidinium_carterae.1